MGIEAISDSCVREGIGAGMGSAAARNSGIAINAIRGSMNLRINSKLQDSI